MNLKFTNDNYFDIFVVIIRMVGMALSPVFIGEVALVNLITSALLEVLCKQGQEMN